MCVCVCVCVCHNDSYHKNFNILIHLKNKMGRHC